MIDPVTLELFKALLAGGVAASVFVFGQVIQRFVFEPVAEMRKLLGQIGTDLVYYANRFSNPSGNTLEEWIEATSTFRRHAAALRSLPFTIPFYDVMAACYSLPRRQQAREASTNLIGISNMTYRDTTSDDYTFKNRQFDAVHRILKIPRE